MKKIILCLPICVFTFFGNCQTNNTCISKTIAEKILGQPAQLIENSSAVKNEINQYKCTYTAGSKENKISNLYFMLEEYKNDEVAHSAYTNILSQNSNMPGLKKIDGIGNEAFIHSDDVNFLLIICRKKNKMLRLKVNKITRVTSLAEMQKAASKLL